MNGGEQGVARVHDLPRHPGSPSDGAGLDYPISRQAVRIRHWRSPRGPGGIDSTANVATSDGEFDRAVHGCWHAAGLRLPASLST